MLEERPFGYTYTYNIDHVNDFKTDKAFSFSLFIGDSVAKILKKNNYDTSNMNDEDYEDFTAWRERYLDKQIKKFNNLIENPLWNEYGVVHFLDENLGKLYLENPYNPEELISCIEYIKEKIELENYLPIVYKCKHKKCAYDSVFAGTLTRFAAMRIPFLSVVIFRDAHTTMPNPKTTYDADWRDFWLSGKNVRKHPCYKKRFLVYSSVDYTPEHNMGLPTMLAAAWSACKLNKREKCIISDDLWKELEKGVKSVKNSSYGIDEQFLSIYFMNNKIFNDQIYFVGFTHIDMMFTPLLNISQMDYLRSKTDPDSIIDYGNFTAKVLKKVAKNNFSNIKISNKLDFDELFDGTRSTVNVFWEGTGCLLSSANDQLTEYNKSIGKKRDDYDVDEEKYQFEEKYDDTSAIPDDIEYLPSLDELFEYVESVLINSDNTLLGNIFRDIPTRHHLWEFLFDFDHLDSEYNQSIYTSSLNLYLSIVDGIEPLNTLNKCKLNRAFKLGQKIHFNEYIFNDKDEEEEPIIENINIDETLPDFSTYKPHNYPLIF